MKKLLFLIGALLLGLLAFSFLGGAANTLSPGFPPLPQSRVARQDLVETAIATGTVKPKVGAEVKVGSQISGVLVELNVNIGDEVAKGDLLALLDDSSLRARVDVLRAEVAAASAEYEYALAELERFESSAMSLPQIQIANSRRNVAVKDAAVDQAKARLAEARAQLGHTRIVAPVSGTVASVSTYVGETVAASFAAPTFLTIIDLDQLEVHAYVDETDIGKVSVGLPIEFRLDSFPDQPLRGTVSAIYPKAQLVNNVVNYVLLIDMLDVGDLSVRPEMTARVNLELSRRDQVLTVPRSALITERGRSFVVTQASSAWAMTEVKIGMRTVRSVEVVAGVKEGQAVLSDAQRWKDSKTDEMQ